MLKGVYEIGVSMSAMGTDCVKTFITELTRRKTRTRDDWLGTHSNRVSFQITLIHVLFFTEEFLHSLGTLRPFAVARLECLQ